MARGPAARGRAAARHQDAAGHERPARAREPESGRRGAEADHRDRRRSVGECTRRRQRPVRQGAPGLGLRRGAAVAGPAHGAELQERCLDR